jgi:hypothetical protein
MLFRFRGEMNASGSFMSSGASDWAAELRSVISVVYPIERERGKNKASVR